MFSINTNLPAIYTSDILSNITEAVNRTVKHLATGKRITTASDDPGSILYLSRLKALNIGWKQAQENISEAQDLLNTAQYALSGINGMKALLYRMRELALEAANTSTLTTEDLNSIQEEIQALVEEIDRIGRVTEYNTKKLFDGSMAGKITSSTPYISGYVTGKVNNANLDILVLQSATKALVKVQPPIPESNRMPTVLGDSYDYTKTLGEAVFSADTTTAASYNADYDIIFTPGNPDHDFVVYEASTGQTVGTGTFGTPFVVSSNNNVSITIYSGSQTIQEGYKGIWHVDTNPSNNIAQEGNLAVSATITIGKLSDTAMINGEIIIEIDWVNNRLSYRASDINGNPLGAWVSVGATFYAYEDSALQGSYFTLDINSVRSGYQNLAGKGDKWKIYFKEYEGVTSSGSILIEITNESYLIPWQSSDTLEALKNNINAEIAQYATAQFVNEGGYQVLEIQANYTGSLYTPQIRDTEGNLAQTMGFYKVSGTGNDALVKIDGTTYGPQWSNIFYNVAPNAVIVLSEGINQVTATVSIKDLSQKVAAGPSQGGEITFVIPPVNSMILGLKDYDGNLLVDVTKPGGAENAISRIDNALEILNSYETKIGAVYNRLQKALSLAQSESEALTRSISLLEDADVAEELVKLTTLELQQNTAAAMLAHSRLQPERVWKLLLGIKD